MTKLVAGGWAELGQQCGRAVRISEASRVAEERAANERRELRGIIETQTIEIGWLERRVEQLIRVSRRRRARNRRLSDQNIRRTHASSRLSDS